MKIVTSRLWITLCWTIGSSLVFLPLILQSQSGSWSDKDEEIIWAWAIPAIFPVLSLVVGVHAAEALSPKKDDRTVSFFFFVLTLGICLAYLSAVLSVVIRPAIDPTFSVAMLIHKSGRWLGVFQGLVTATFGIFYVHKRRN